MADTTLANQNLNDLPGPLPWPGANRRLILGGGAPIQPIKRVGAFSDKEFEIFVLEWVHGYLSKKYVEVQQRGSAGDKGRDIVAWLDPIGTPRRRWDNYQCKHYKDPLTPTEIWVELGKLCYYTFKGDYTVPENLFFVTHQSVGNKLADLLDDSTALREQLIVNWEKYCRKKITDTEEVPLEGALEEYVSKFDFSIVRSVPPADLIEQHSKTPYHALIFGTAFKPRPKPTAPPSGIAAKEARYVRQLYEAFSDHIKKTVTDQSGFSGISYLKSNFDHARVCFYSAESLKEFARDNLPDDTYFTDLLDQFEEGITVTINAHYVDGYARMIKTVETALSLMLGAHVLRDELRPNDRTGMCHQLANEERIRWVK